MVYSMQPIDKKAGEITSQKHCSDSFLIGAAGLREVLINLKKRHGSLKEQLGIKNKRQLRNLMYKFNKKGRRSFGFKNRDKFLEIVHVGREISRIQSSLSAKNKEVIK